MQNTTNDDLQNIETDQSEDTRISAALGQLVTARLVSRLSRESREQSLPGQDYALLISRAGGTSISLCVCDGVGSSYKGNFAARYLASCLVAWLQQLPVIPQKTAKVVRPLRSRLHSWARDAQQTLADFAIAPGVPALVREVLEELRQAHGSETVFFCGRIDLVKPVRGMRIGRPQELALPVPPGQPRVEGRLQGSPLPSRDLSAQGIFLWMGNVAAQLFCGEDAMIELGEREDDAPRWSTARGQRGLLAARSIFLERIDRLLVYTDGLHPISDRLAVFDDDELSAEMDTLLARPANDDMTLLDLQWTHPDPAPGKEETR